MWGKGKFRLDCLRGGCVYRPRTKPRRREAEDTKRFPTFSREGEGYEALFAKRIRRSWMRVFRWWVAVSGEPVEPRLSSEKRPSTSSGLTGERCDCKPSPSSDQAAGCQVCASEGKGLSVHRKLSPYLRCCPRGNSRGSKIAYLLYRHIEYRILMLKGKPLKCHQTTKFLSLTVSTTRLA